MGFGESPERVDRAGCGLDVRVGGGDEVCGRGDDAAVDIGSEAERAVVPDRPCARGGRRAAGVGDEDELIDLGCEGLEARAGVRVAGRPDDDCGDGQISSR
jgi:hypothetical protein